MGQQVSYLRESFISDCKRSVLCGLGPEPLKDSLDVWARRPLLMASGIHDEHNALTSTPEARTTGATRNEYCCHRAKEAETRHRMRGTALPSVLHDVVYPFVREYGLAKGSVLDPLPGRFLCRSCVHTCTTPSAELRACPVWVLGMLRACGARRP